MNSFAAASLALLSSFASVLPAQDVISRARQLETSGDARQAREMLQTAATREPSASLAYAELLDRYHDLEARQAYRKALSGSISSADKARVEKRLQALDLLAGEGQSAAAAAATPEAHAAVPIPGPLRSFARMAALSPDLSPNDIMMALARNIVTNGYQAAANNEGLEQTEYLKLIIRYLGQARELEKLAGSQQALVVESCDSTQTGDLLRVLGYRMRGACGSEVVLETVNATRAFLTIDSGFPLAELEQALRTNRPWRYDYKPTQAALLYTAEYWLSANKDKPEGEFIDAFLGDPAVCRLYLGLSKLDRATAEEIRKAVPAIRIKAYSHVFDFYGSMFQIRNGKAIVPGGVASQRAWQELVGASPDTGAAFFEKLVMKDDGWLASYFDATARLNGPTREYLTHPDRMRRIYNAIRGKLTSPGPARPVFRANTDMMLLTSRMRLDSDGKPHVPGGFEVWKNLFVNHPHGKYDGKLTKAATTWKDSDDLIDALFALSRKSVENEPLKIYMVISDLNRQRAKPLETATVDRLAREYRTYGAMYTTLSVAPALTDATILQFLDMLKLMDDMKDHAVKADVIGTFHALTSLWQIFVRQESIPQSDADGVLAGLLADFSKAKEPREVFDAGRSGTRRLLAATKSAADVSPQDRMIDLLAGATSFDKDEDTHRVLIRDMMTLFETQRLLSLKTIFDLADHLDKVAEGGTLDNALVGRLASRMNELQLPRAALSVQEKNALSFGYWTDKHVDAQRKMNLRATIEKAKGDPEKLRNVRGLLAPILRDSLVGFSYIHYAPPGAQILQTNPLFVRSHDFLGSQGVEQAWRRTEVLGNGWPSSAGGRLVGSLVSLPYALAEAEQNFLIPSREQALIWGDLVPQMILSAKVPRWWNVTPAQMHWVALHLHYGEELVAESALDATRRQEVMTLYERQAAPARVAEVTRLLEQRRVRDALELMMPAELFQVAVAMAQSKPGDSMLASSIKAMAAEQPQLTYAAISRAFGTPHPTLANSYTPELLNLRTFPTLMGYSSRIMAESWESSLLYYAMLADEVNLAPTQLNIMVPQWTQATVEKIFATHLEDWPALLRSLRLVGEEVRAGGRKQLQAGLE